MMVLLVTIKENKDSILIQTRPEIQTGAEAYYPVHSVPSRGGGIKKFFFPRFFCRILKSYVGIAYKKFDPTGATKFDPENHV